MIDDPPETTEQVLTRRQRFFHALGAPGPQQLVPLLEAADSDDLRWILRILEIKLNERADPVTDLQSLRRSRDDLRLKRSLVISRLGNVEMYEKQAAADRRRRAGVTREALQLARSLVRRQ
jgi:hypothetical protein